MSQVLEELKQLEDAKYGSPFRCRPKYANEFNLYHDAHLEQQQHPHWQDIALHKCARTGFREATPCRLYICWLKAVSAEQCCITFASTHVLEIVYGTGI